VRDFDLELYAEYLEEAAFLYQQRLSLLRDPEIGWTEIRAFEERLEAHIDGLVVGGEPALEVCTARAVEGDAGELFAAVCVFCRQRRSNHLSDVLRALDADDSAKLVAVSDALKYELPDEWHSYVVKALARANACLTAVLAPVVGYRRMELSQVLVQAMSATPHDVSADIVAALGRNPSAEAAGALARCLSDASAEVRSAALVSLLRSESQDALLTFACSGEVQGWQRIAIGLGGNDAAVPQLISTIETNHGDRDCVIALGLLGDPKSLQTLYDSLKKPELAEAAALALDWITGAHLMESTFIPEEVREDELTPRELEAWRESKKAPVRGDGTAFGQNVTRFSRDKEAWKRWFREHASTLDPGLRYRNGKPYAPGCLLENLADQRSDHVIRRYAAEELTIRYGCDVRFEVDMPVLQQFKALREISAWIDANAGRFRPGLWYFAGKPMGRAPIS